MSSAANIIVVLVKCRTASKLVTNRFLFGNRFDQPAGSSEALFSNRESNLAPSKEGGQPDCGHANREDV